MNRTCKCCKEVKDIYFFDKSGINGYRFTCRQCRNQKNTSSYLSKPGNVESRREYQKEYQKQHRKNNPYYQLYCKCIWTVKNNIYSIKNNMDKYQNNPLKLHLESLFNSGMNWDNYGSAWEIDHIVSATKMAKAGYTIEEINKLSNIRPLMTTDNRHKAKENRDEKTKKES